MINFSGRLIVSNSFNIKNIVSYGIIVFTLDTEKMLVVRRKHSVEFVILMKGSYRPTHLPFLISMLTDNEKNHIVESLNDKNYFYNLYSKEIYFKKLNVEYVYLRFSENREEILNLIFFFKNTNNQLKWQWPKGRPNSKETPFSCAKREFFEEVESELPPILAMEDKLLETSFVSLNGRIVESKYFFCVISNEFELKNVSHNDEVSERKWVHISEIRNYISLESDVKILNEL